MFKLVALPKVKESVIMPPPSSPPTLASAPSSAGTERRLWERYPCELWAVSPASSAPEAALGWTATVCDASVGGLGLVLDRQLDPGAELLVELRAPADGLTQQLRLRVVHAQPLSDSQWRVGCVVLD
jgi:hypothetical protein